MPAGKVIQLSWVDFELEEEGTSWWSDGCDDYLKITDKDGTVLMDKTCGKALPIPQEFKRLSCLNSYS